MRALVVLLAALTLPCFAQDRKADAERALRDIDAFTAVQAKTDPHYRAAEDVLLKEIDQIIRQHQPADWLPIIRRRYFALSEAAHASERDAIRESEMSFYRTLGPGDAGWTARAGQLEDDLKAGKLAPREHALRAAEAARLYHRGNDIFIAWREAKVPIATEYELGAITRSQYEERWNRTTALFMERQAADDRMRAQIGAQMAAEEYRAGMQRLEQLRPRPMVRCSTTTAYGVTTTRCF